MEARGLDVTPGMIEKIAKMNDPQGVAILTRIYNDEQQHVRFGSDWFKRLCQQQNIQPDSAFQALITEYYRHGKPKGPFNREMRLSVGFSVNELAWLESS